MSDEFTNSACAPSDCASCGLDCGGNASEEQHNTITLTLDDDTEVECAILTIFPVDAQEYMHSFHWMRMVRTRTVKFICTVSPAQRRAIRCLPTSMMMLNIRQQLQLLTLFLTMHVRQRQQAHR